MALPRYRADPPALRRTVALDDALTLIFHRPSATTHVVGSPVPEILNALVTGPADAEEVLARLSVAHDLVVSGDGADEVATHLDGLVAAGLAARE